MSQFTKPVDGNKNRNMAINSVRNLQRWLNRQARDAQSAKAP